MLQVTEGPDRGATLHFGDPVKEQKALAAGAAGRRARARSVCNGTLVCVRACRHHGAHHQGATDDGRRGRGSHGRRHVHEPLWQSDKLKTGIQIGDVASGSMKTRRQNRQKLLPLVNTDGSHIIRRRFTATSAHAGKTQ